MSEEALTAEAIRAHSGARWIGREMHCLQSVDSTNTRARELGVQGALDGTVVTAEEQTAGRGRRGRTWLSPPGRNLYMSIVLRSELPPESIAQLSLVAGVACAEALAEWCAPRLKWPNDVLVAGRKVVGILAELESRGAAPFVVLGIGVNVNMELDDFPPELRDKAGSLAVATGSHLSRARVAGRILACLEQRYDELRRRGFGAAARRWCELSGFVGCWLEVQEPGGVVAGEVLRLDDDGALRLLLADGREHRVLAGDVTVLDGYAHRDAAQEGR